MKRLFLLFSVAGLLSFVSAAALPNSALAADNCNSSVFGIPAWYNGQTEGEGDGCHFEPTKSEDGTIDMVKTGAKIGANLLSAALVLVAYVTIFFLIRGGFAYMTSTGSPDGMAAAKKTISNALIGLVIAILAASIVNAIGAAIK